MPQRCYSQPYGEKMLAGCLSELAATSSYRNNKLFRVTLRLGRAVAAGLLDEGRVRGELEETAHRIGLGQSEIRYTIASGLRIGFAHPL